MNISTAQSEYFARTADERYSSPSALLAFEQARKDASREVTYNAKDLRVHPHAGQPYTTTLVSPNGRSARFTAWSFGQLARTAGAPAGYVASLPNQIQADALNYGLSRTTPGTDLKLLVQSHLNGTLLDTTAPQYTADRALPPILRAVTSEQYGRVWDVDLHRAMRDTFGIGDAPHGAPDATPWHLPTAWDGKPAGAYTSDRDSFLITINGGSIVEDPTMQGQNRQMFRGVIVRNSEVGAASIVIDAVLFRWICGNLMLWGAQYDRRFKRQHRGPKAGRDAIREILTLARTFADRPASVDQEIIKVLAAHELAATRAGMIDELRALGMTETDAEAAYDAAEINEPNPRSFWGIAQGITRISQAHANQGDRYLLDQMAAKLLSSKRALVAA